MKKKVWANLFFLRQTNGMYYYALKILSEMEMSGVYVDVLVKNCLADEAAEDLVNLEKIKVRGVSNLGFLYFYIRSFFLSAYIFCPSFHPLPFVRRQMVVFHDAYPYRGRLGWVKLFIKKLALRSSNTSVGVVNQTDAVSFFNEVNITSIIVKVRFMPNFFSREDVVPRLRGDVPKRRSDGSVKYKIGLAGTDSDKKGYEQFLALHPKKRADFQFIFYGHETQYWSELQDQFPDLDCLLCHSSTVPPESFLSQVDVLCQVNDQEGCGRMIAFALLANVPVVALWSEVAQEIYGDCIQLSANLEGVWKRLLLADFGGGARDRFLSLTDSHKRATIESMRSFLNEA